MKRSRQKKEHKGRKKGEWSTSHKVPASGGSFINSIITCFARVVLTSRSFPGIGLPLEPYCPVSNSTPGLDPIICLHPAVSRK